MMVYLDGQTNIVSQVAPDVLNDMHKRVSR